MEKKNSGKNLEEHSKVKLDLYKKYLSAYLEILSSVGFNINIYDIFCGIGKFDNGDEGSPLLAMRELDNVSKKKRGNYSLTINDSNSESVRSTKNELEKLNSNSVKVYDFNLSASKMFENVLEGINRQPSSDRNLIFVDPWGYSDINFGTLSKLMGNGRTELVIFLPTTNMYRFSKASLTDRENNSYAPLRGFIESFLCDFLNQIESYDLNSFVNAIENGFSYSSKYLTTSFNLKGIKGNWYSLFFVTTQWLALERINAIKWKIDPSRGMHFDSTAPAAHGQLDIFGTNTNFTDTDKLKGLILNDLKNSDQDNVSLGKLIIRSGYLPKHGKKVIEELINEGKINYIDISSNKKPRGDYFNSKYFKELPKTKISLANE